MKESLPKNYPNLSELSEERKNLRQISGGVQLKSVKRAVESAQKGNKEKAKGLGNIGSQTDIRLKIRRSGNHSCLRQIGQYGRR